MKCEVCRELLEEYCDRELTERESSEVAAHLVTCAACSAERSAFAVEQQMFSHYDRELDVPPSMFAKIAERALQPVTPSVSRNGFGALLARLFPFRSFTTATVAALILLALVIGALYVRTRKPDNDQTMANRTIAPAVPSHQEDAPQP